MHAYAVYLNYLLCNYPRIIRMRLHTWGGGGEPVPTSCVQGEGSIQSRHSVRTYSVDGPYIETPGPQGGGAAAPPGGGLRAAIRVL